MPGRRLSVSGGAACGRTGRRTGVEAPSLGPGWEGILVCLCKVGPGNAGLERCALARLMVFWSVGWEQGVQPAAPLEIATAGGQPSVNLQRCWN